ncbi:MAG: SPOR domain-containing protein [Phycisphaeraceae bacterium]
MKQSTRMWRGWVAATVLVLLAGCAAPGDTTLNEATDAYQQGRYEAAYQAAARLTRSAGASGDVAAYLAGLAAERLERLDEARHHFQRAARSADEELAADARASLGLLHHRQGRYREAADVLERAARALTGEQRANAYFYAGIAQQKVDRWAQARTDFVLARAATSDSSLRRRIDQHLAVTGYTIQIGAFRDRANARRAAERFASRARQLDLGSPRLVEADQLTLVQVGRFSSYRTAQRARQRLGAEQAIVAPIMSQ